MNLCASIITMLLVDIIIKILIAMQIPKFQTNLLIRIIDGTLVSYQISLLIFIFIGIIYVISYFTKIDDKTAYDKIESLSIPSLWKQLMKQTTDM